MMIDDSDDGNDNDGDYNDEDGNDDVDVYTCI